MPLTEDSVGKYHTPETFAGEIGVKYKLSIELQEGKKYESDYVELLDVPDISELEAEKIIKPATATSLESIGYQFYISTKPGSSEQKYYKWDVFEDWEYRLPYKISAYWDGTVLYQIDPPSLINVICILNSTIFTYPILKIFKQIILLITP